jgi:hypothetical protein
VDEEEPGPEKGKKNVLVKQEAPDTPLDGKKKKAASAAPARAGQQSLKNFFAKTK